MATPVYTRPTDKEYLGNSSPGHIVHDLDNEDTSPNACQIDEIISAGNAVVFDPDTLEQAYSEGYNNCDYCIGSSTR